MLAREIMTVRVITVHPEDTVQQLARALTEGGVSGAPVMDPDHNLVGIVSEADVISKRGPRVDDVMQRHVITVEDTLPVEEVCRVLSENNINRVPVLRDGEMVGIITRTDIVRAIATGCLQPDLTSAQPPQTDSDSPSA